MFNAQCSIMMLPNRSNRSIEMLLRDWERGMTSKSVWHLNTWFHNWIPNWFLNWKWKWTKNRNTFAIEILLTCIFHNEFKIAIWPTQVIEHILLFLSAQLQPQTHRQKLVLFWYSSYPDWFNCYINFTIESKNWVLTRWRNWLLFY